MNEDLIDTTINDNKLMISYKGEEGNRYAFRLFLEKKMIGKLPYSQQNKAEFLLEEHGKYTVKIFEQDVGRDVQTIFTEPILFGIADDAKKKYVGSRKVVVRAANVTKKFRMYKRTSDKLKSLISSSDNIDYHSALRNVSFEIQNGEVIGIVGVNGSGKSTLSNLLAGVSSPTDGTLLVRGKALMLAVGIGMNAQLTGLENIKFKCLMMGLSEARIKEITPDIIAFAELGKFIHQPVKTYSSGMKSRLGFAISVNVDPDILIIDEALSVGDARFTQRCLDKIYEFVEKGKTIFFVSHSAGQMRKFCTKAIWLHDGRIVEYDEIDTVVDKYQQFLSDYNDYKTGNGKLSLRLKMKYGIYD